MADDVNNGDGLKLPENIKINTPENNEGSIIDNNENSGKGIEPKIEDKKVEDKKTTTENSNTPPENPYNKTNEKVEDKVEDKIVDDNKQVENNDDTQIENNDEDDLSDVQFVLKDVSTQLGVQLSDRELQLFNEIIDKNFGDDPNVLANVVSNFGRVLGSKMINEYYNGLPEQVKRFANYIKNGGDEATYFQVKQLNYSKINIPKDNAAIQKDVLIEGNMKLHGMSLQDATDYASVLIDTGKGFDKAIEMKNKLVQHQQGEITKVEQEAHNRYLQALENAKQQRAYTKSKIDTGVLNVNGEQFVIPETQRKELHYAITTPFYDQERKCYYDANLNPISKQEAAKRPNDLISIADAAKMQYGADAEILNAYFFLYGGLDKLVKQKVASEKVNRYKKYSEDRHNNKNIISNTQQQQNDKNTKTIDVNKTLKSKVE